MVQCHVQLGIAHCVRLLTSSKEEPDPQSKSKTFGYEKSWGGLEVSNISRIDNEKDNEVSNYIQYIISSFICIYNMYIYNIYIYI